MTTDYNLKAKLSRHHVLYYEEGNFHRDTNTWTWHIGALW